MMHKIVVLDRPRENPGELDWSPLFQLGEVSFYDFTPKDLLEERIGDADIVIINSCPMRAEILEKCPSIRFISTISTGYDLIDIAKCSELGITVSNVPSYGTEALSQQAVALLMELTNRVAYHDQEVRKGRTNTPTDWSFWDYPTMELEGKTAGIIGLGRIGKCTARIMEAFGMKVLAFNRSHDESWETSNRRYVPLDTLLQQSDVVFLHCPLNESSYHIINSETIARMKKGAIIINNGRGALIDSTALANALKTGYLAGAGLDTLEHEPPEPDDPLLRAPNCYITPHISWAALECRQRLMHTTIENVKAFIDGNPQNTVTRA